jgi:hypothetical protein
LLMLELIFYFESNYRNKIQSSSVCRRLNAKNSSLQLLNICIYVCRNCGHDKTISSILLWSPVAAGTFLIVFGMKVAKI